MVLFYTLGAINQKAACTLYLLESVVHVRKWCYRHGMHYVEVSNHHGSPFETYLVAAQLKFSYLDMRHVTHR